MPDVTYQPPRALCAVGCMRLLDGRRRDLLATTLPDEDFAIFGSSSLNISEPVTIALGSDPENLNVMIRHARDQLVHPTIA